MCHLPLFVPDSCHALCNPNLPGSCTRCMLQQPDLCCELCSPSFFSDFARTSISKLPAAPSRSKLRDHISDNCDMALKKALHRFRTETAVQKYGQAYFTDYGAGIVMSQRILQCVVDCAHANKINSKDDLLKETCWVGAEQHGDAVLQLIATHRPPPVPSSMPLIDINTNSIFGSTSTICPPGAKQQCKACGSFDHIGRHSFFEYYSIDRFS